MNINCTYNFDSWDKDTAFEFALFILERHQYRTDEEVNEELAKWMIRRGIIQETGDERWLGSGLDC
jgi:hypothetical protein